MAYRLSPVVSRLRRFTTSRRLNLRRRPSWPPAGRAGCCAEERCFFPPASTGSVGPASSPILTSRFASCALFALTLLQRSRFRRTERGESSLAGSLCPTGTLATIASLRRRCGMCVPWRDVSRRARGFVNSLATIRSAMDTCGRKFLVSVCFVFCRGAHGLFGRVLREMNAASFTPLWCGLRGDCHGTRARFSFRRLDE